ncbi:luciferase family oxidoreductase group 1 [Motilibacter rhizosphaerae]|uniref:Luciferase family oxidoreductase group 1 n=1 Tax=Motilibacter rhizosphaerae TaxID=598652 RepID=A0A4Q7NQG1_9ACTN|nr:LLM class flavin-dependent oxidoreductase [Motilibacter rhizosphaerae]RZS87574.1 luciferase family oxidoreductase group 1 [Motilibacter rhizosphaerae]
MARVPLSVLDLSPVGTGQTSGAALHASARLAQAAEAEGYQRYWVAEHHAMPMVASTSPAVLLAHVGALTSTIRLGSGGVMLPNHAPLVVAEQFAMLEALHPGRVDLGIGRAPGSDPATAAALRRTLDLSAEDFPGELDTLLRMLGDPTLPAPRGGAIAPTPAPGSSPAVWLLGSSDYGARAAAGTGLPYAFAHHFAPAGTELALETYRALFQPSSALARPYSMIVAAVLVAPTEDEAQRLALPQQLVQVALRTGRPRPVPTVEEALAHEWTPMERAVLEHSPSTPVVGEPGKVVAELDELVERTGVDELMVVTSTYAPEHRERSLRLLAEAWRG